MSLSHFIFLAIGSRGDIEPLKWISLELAQRGHHVLLLTLPAFCKEFAKLGLRALASPADLEVKLEPKRGFRPLRLLSRSIDDWVRTRRIFERRTAWTIEELEKRHVGGNTVVVGRPGLFAGRLARELWDVRLATVHHAPASMRSRTESFRFFDAPTSPLKRLANRFAWSGMDAFVGALLLPWLNRLRVSRGLRPVRRIFDGWASSPDLNLALFPAWYATPQPDWPPNSRHVAFPVPATSASMPANVTEFLSSGRAPLLVTIGAHEDPGGKLERTIEELVSGGAFRCIFLGRAAPSSSNAGLLHCEFVPLGLVLPHCRAILHHGGVGTMAAAFRAGTPQVVSPIVGDQWDQARRAAKLGCAKIISLGDLKRSLPRALAEIESDPLIAAACQAIREQALSEDGVKSAADRLEEVAAAARRGR